MEHTIHANSRMIGYRLAYLFSEPKTGDIIIFKYPDDEAQTYVKRVIGTPGDTVSVKKGVVYLNGEALKEDYVYFKIKKIENVNVYCKYKLYDYEYYNEIVEKSLENVKRFSWNKCQEEVIGFYKEVLENRNWRNKEDDIWKRF